MKTMRCLLIVLLGLWPALPLRADTSRFYLRFVQPRHQVYYSLRHQYSGRVALEVYPAQITSRIAVTAPAARARIDKIERAGEYLWVTYTPLSAYPFRLTARLAPAKHPPADRLQWSALASCQVKVITRLRASFPLALVVLIHGDNALMDACGRLAVANSIGFAYHHIDYLSVRAGTAGDFFAKIRARCQQGYQVDVVILSHGSRERLWVGRALTGRQIRRALRHQKGLRWVYMLGCVSASLVDDWRAVGAQAVVGHVGDNHLPHLFFPYFFMLLGEGASIQNACRQAYTWALNQQLILAQAAPYDTPARMAQHMRSSTPYFAGQNFTLLGNRQPAEPNLQARLDSRFTQIHPQPVKPSRLERYICKRLAAVIPPPHRQALRNIHVLSVLRKAGGVFWQILQALFPQQKSRGQITLPSDLVIKYLHQDPFMRRYCSQWTQCRPSIARLSAQRYQLSLALPPNGVSYELLPSQLVGPGQPYRLSLAAQMSAYCCLKANEVSLEQIRGCAIYMHLPYFPDKFYLHSVRLDMQSAQLSLWAYSAYTLIPVHVQLDLWQIITQGYK